MLSNRRLVRPGARPSRLPRVAVTALLATIALPTHANNASSVTAAQPVAPEPEEIIVWSLPQFRDLRPERDLDEAAISGYGVSTIEDLLGEVQAELDGDTDEPVYVVNGERINDLDDIAGYPVEALRQLQVLPRGSATRVGGRAGQRVVSLNLHRQMRSAAALIAPRIATEGDFQSDRGEAIFTYIRGRTRANVTLRVRDEGALLESERGLLQPEARRPFAITGNLVSAFLAGDEIDPMLSSAAGQMVTVARLPSTVSPRLADFAASANEASMTDLGAFRTLRPDARNYDLNATYSTRLAEWLTSTATAKFNRSNSRSLRGLPSPLFMLDDDNIFSPFSTPVALAYYELEPLSYRSTRDSGEGNVTLNARLGRWQANFNGRHVVSRDHSRSDRQGQSQIDVPNSFNPFGGGLLDLMPPLGVDRYSSRSRTSSTRLTLTSSPFRLPAGEVQTNVEGRLSWSRFKARSSFSGGEERTLSRAEQGVRGGIEVPLASRDSEFLGRLGELRATADYGIGHVSKGGTVRNHALGLVWEPVPAVRLRGAIEATRLPADIELLGTPVTVVPDVRIFDVLTGETVDVVQVSGGNPDLRPERNRTRRLSGLFTLKRSIGLQANAEYVDLDEENFVSSLPPLSAAVVAALPDRFQRDPGGTLTRVDLRPVNFASHRQKRIRYGFNLNLPLGGGAASPRSVSLAADADDVTDSPPAARPGPARSATRLQLTANHNLVLKDEISIRPELDSIDLLDGGAIGIGGGRVRHQFDGTAALTSGGLGARLGLNWRGGNVLETRLAGHPTRLSFSPLLLLNLRLFADAKRVLPSTTWLSGTRFSINAVNLTGKRQRVRDANGDVPLQFQPAYRDPIGRTVEFELRKAF